MKVKQWAVFFALLLSFEYIEMSLAFVASNSTRDNELVHYRHKRKGNCQPTEELIKVIGDCLSDVAEKLDDSFDLSDETVDSLQLTSGSAAGFNNFKLEGTPKCTCEKNSVIIRLEINFLRITITYTLSLLEGLLGGLLGNLGTSLTRLLGDVVNLVLNILALNVRVLIQLRQVFLPGTTCEVIGFEVVKVTKLELLGLDLTFVANLLQGILTPVLTLVLRLVLTGPIQAIFVEEIQKIIITKSMIRCS
ncbi:uncharacterized protein LOC118179435 [Stegodyphus dumicola]|uniref:uncharacterized protein LOC118179435 n=1 Tax=Stegodyphus dumicola TaxID=202533 RepID=UPI0015AE4E4F|nr:uncharacterized protein LOC118179435 [Stegodyphus dumicola]